jgi:hypothetical protein
MILWIFLISAAFTLSVPKIPISSVNTLIQMVEKSMMKNAHSLNPVQENMVIQAIPKISKGLSTSLKEAVDDFNFKSSSWEKLDNEEIMGKAFELFTESMKKVYENFENTSMQIFQKSDMHVHLQKRFGDELNEAKLEKDGWNAQFQQLIQKKSDDLEKIQHQLLEKNPNLKSLHERIILADRKLASFTETESIVRLALDASKMDKLKSFMNVLSARKQYMLQELELLDLRSQYDQLLGSIEDSIAAEKKKMIHIEFFSEKHRKEFMEKQNFDLFDDLSATNRAITKHTYDLGGTFSEFAFEMQIDKLRRNPNDMPQVYQYFESLIESKRILLDELRSRMARLEELWRFSLKEGNQKYLITTADMIADLEKKADRLKLEIDGHLKMKPFLDKAMEKMSLLHIPRGNSEPHLLTPQILKRISSIGRSLHFAKRSFSSTDVFYTHIVKPVKKVLLNNGVKILMRYLMKRYLHFLFK